MTEVSSGCRLDLLPSSLDLIDVQDRIAMMAPGRFYNRAPGEILYTALKQDLDRYDWVIIDCPPNLGLITLNGLRFSDGYVIPTIPDVLSTYGIPQILNRVDQFAREINESIEAFGIIISKYRDQATLHRQVVQQLRRDRKLPPVFDTVIPEAAAIAGAAEHAGLGTLGQKYSYGGRYELYRPLTGEIEHAVEGLLAA